MKASLLWRNPKVLFLGGLLIRELFTWWTGLPYDMEVWIRNGYYVSGGSSPYSFFPPVPGLSFAYLNQSLGSVGYLPMWSLILSGIFRVYSIVGGGNRFVFYFLVKQPGVFGDLWLAYLLRRAVLTWGGTRQSALSAMRFWIFFPYAIVISAIWGQFDALVAALLFCFLLATKTSRRSLHLGLGIFLKLVPTLFVPFMLVRSRLSDWKAQVLAAMLPTVSTFLVMAFWGWELGPLGGTLSSQVLGLVPLGLTFLNFLASPVMLPILFRIPYFYEVVRLLWIPTLLVATVFAARRFPSASIKDTAQAFMLVLCAFFLSRWGVNEQLIIYFLPLLLVDVLVWHPERRLLFHMTWVLALLFLTANNDLFLLFVGPVAPDLMNFALQLHDVNNLTLLAAARYVTVDLLGVIFSIHLVQVMLVLIRNKQNATPWLLHRLTHRMTTSKVVESASDGTS